jgi:hypothetical protein
MVDKKRVTLFHPDFPSCYPLGGTITECQGGISFRFPLDLLSISTPFADAAEISCFAGSDSGSDSDSGCDFSTRSTRDETITLTNVPPQGFHILLTALHPLTPYFSLHDKVSRLGSKSVDDLLEGYQVAEILDIPTPTFSRLLIPYFRNPFTKFALSTATSSLYGSKVDNDLVQSMTMGTLQLPFDSMPRFANWLLLALNPEYHVRLRVLHEERQKMPTTLFKAFCGAPTPDGVDAFSKKCLKLGCPASRSVKKGCWMQLRARAASQVWEVLSKNDCLLWERVEIANKVLEGSCKGCPRCLERLSACIAKCIHDLEASLPVNL